MPPHKFETAEVFAVKKDYPLRRILNNQDPGSSGGKARGGPN